jgi:hypothetical protein
MLDYHVSIIVITDHKNNSFNGLKANISGRFLLSSCILILKKYGVTFEYIPGKKHKNVVADALSRLDIDA